VNARSVIAPRHPSDAPHVLDVFHREILRQLARLVDLACATQPGASEPSQARELIAFFEGPAREHNDDEERHALATLLQCDDADVRRAAEILREDHAWIELHWLDIEPQLAAMAAEPSNVDHTALRSAAEVFASLMRDHITLAESLLYPQLRGRLKLTVMRSINRAIDARRDTGSPGGQRS
jgi:hemerythrin-like domain-containing protein